MSKLFVSYRRKSWGFTHRLADELRQRLDAEVFVDVDSIDQPDFEKSILRHLHESDVVLLVITDLTFADRIHHEDDWVRHEIREALTLGLPIVLVSVDGLLPPLGLPEDIKEVAKKQGIEFYPRYFITCVEHLIDFVTRVSPVRRKGITGVANITLEPMTLTATATIEDPLERHLKHQEILNTALDLHDNGNHSKSIFLLEELKADGFNSPFVNLDELLADARKYEATALHRRKAQIEYEEIASLVKRRVTRERGMDAFQKWRQKYVDLTEELDSDNIRGQSPVFGHSKPVDQVSLTSSPIKKRIYTPGELITASILEGRNTNISSLDLMPKPFDWIDIPAGNVNITTKMGWTENYIPAGTTQSLRVKDFKISKYPITNAQFQLFCDANGYSQSRWWTEAGWQERETRDWTRPHYSEKTEWNKPTHPVVGVSWYEALAYCNWLSDITEEKITLPTEQQWQRAAQGETTWKYPYGETFNELCCNFHSETTSDVRKYSGPDKGDSPFGVVDMSGNIWEWCLTEYETGEKNIEGNSNRVLRGGSWYDDQIENLQVDLRVSINPGHETNHWGFRIVRN